MRALKQPASAILAATTVLLTGYWILAALGQAIEKNGVLYWCSLLSAWVTVATLPSILLPCWLAYRREPTVERRRDLRFALGCWAVLFLESLPVLFQRPTI